MYFMVGSLVGEKRLNTPAVEGRPAPKGSKSMLPVMEPAWAGSDMNRARSSMLMVPCMVKTLPAAAPSFAPVSRIGFAQSEAA